MHLALLIRSMVIKWNGGPHRAASSEHAEPACPCCLLVSLTPFPYTNALSSSVQYANVWFAVGCSRITSLDKPNNCCRNGPFTYKHTRKIKARSCWKCTSGALAPAFYSVYLSGFWFETKIMPRFLYRT